MEKNKTRTRYITLGAIVVIAIMLISTVALIIYSQTQSNLLYPTEVQNYEGENLSSISDVYENAIHGTQFINESTYRLTVDGLVDEPKAYTYDEVSNNFTSYHKVVTIYCVEGWSAKILWQGVLVRDLLNASGLNNTAKVVIFHAQDGYTTSLPVTYFYENDILLAYKMNNLTIPIERGFPFELVAESQYGYKWIKWITQIELSSNADYLGYWESRGYPNDATLR